MMISYVHNGPEHSRASRAVGFSKACDGYLGKEESIKTITTIIDAVGFTISC